MNTEPSVDKTSAQGQTQGVGTGDLVRHFFPRTPERDAEDNAQLYPGSPIYEGVGAVWTTRHGEVVILAPNFEALEDQIKLCGCFNGMLNQSRCRIVKIAQMPNVKDDPRRSP